MSSLPSLRGFDDAELAESSSDSEELLALKFKERMRRKREQREREQREREECERAEHEACEARERAEREEREVREAWERRAREEKERAAREEVRLGKVSAQRFRRHALGGPLIEIFCQLASGGGPRGGHCL